MEPDQNTEETPLVAAAKRASREVIEKSTFSGIEGEPLEQAFLRGVEYAKSQPPTDEAAPISTEDVLLVASENNKLLRVIRNDIKSLLPKKKEKKNKYTKKVRRK